ncbi:MAG: hypothetical protein OER88_08125, partial [Planctomycetota bacterium]|nr:hypothetical protein [Planctomycetota bacterium]
MCPRENPGQTRNDSLPDARGAQIEIGVEAGARHLEPSPRLAEHDVGLARDAARLGAEFDPRRLGENAR